MSATKKCESCRREFPMKVLWMMAVIEKGMPKRIEYCPICALQDVNKRGGLPPEAKFTAPPWKVRDYGIAVAHLKKTKQSLKGVYE